MRDATALDWVTEQVRAARVPNDPVEARALDAAVHDLDRALAELHAGLEICVSPSDGWGYCSDCGARMERKPHKRGGDSLGCGALVPFAAFAALAAFWRRLRVRLASPPPPTREDQ